ncbi:MAG: CHASE domain-containing protein [Polyangiaceae bacterium]|nr:CHASE domain-containing protein [Polyangiaceae bacterium]
MPRTREKPTEPLGSSTLGSRRHAPAVATFIVGVLVTLAIFWVRLGDRRAEQKLGFERRAADAASVVVNGLDGPLESLYAIPALFAASDEVTRKDFREFVTGALKRHPGIYAFEWLPWLAQGERVTFEQEARDEGLEGFTFTEVGKGGRMVPAPTRKRYAPIFYMVPPHPEALGFNLTGDPKRLAPYTQARDSGKTVASGRIRLVEDAPGVHSIAVFHPVYSHGFPPQSPSERRLRFLGCAVEVFRVKPVLERALRDHDVTELGVEVLDRSASAADQQLFEKSTTGTGPRLGYERSFSFADRKWAVVVSSVVPVDRGPLWLLFGGLASSILLALVVSGGRTILHLRKQVQAAAHLGQYTLMRKLGEGGMGVVYEATHAMLRRPTALKLLPAERRDDSRLARFEREVQLTSQLTHPNTIAIYDYGRTPDDVFYYAMEYIAGLTLEQLVREDGPQPPARVVQLLRQVLGALAEAHAVGLVHRDIKPANLMISRRGNIPDFVKVLDFGLVKKQVETEADLKLSRTNTFVGTPHYLAPEAITEGEVGPEADIYAVGAVAYFLLSGTTVFEGENMVAVCTSHVYDEPVPPSLRLGKKVPEALEQLVLRCLSKDPKERPSALALSEELAALTDVGSWTEEDAERWWLEVGDELVEDALERTRRGAAARTMAIDLRRRRESVEYAPTVEDMRREE